MTEQLPFVHLHGHSTYSFLDGYGTPQQIIERIVELGHTSVAITDHGAIFGHAPHQQACAKSGVKPIFGCEMYLVEDMDSRTRMQHTIGDEMLPHVTVIAQNQRGYQNLLHMIRESNTRGFYYKPRIDFKLLASCQEGLIVLSGCPGGFPTQLLIHKGMEEAYIHVSKMKEMVQNYFVEIVPEPGISEFDGVSDQLVTIARSLRLPIVITADAHFPRATDHHAQDVMFCVGMGKKVYQHDRMSLPNYQYYCSSDEILERAKAVMPGTPLDDIRQGIVNSSILAESCQVEIPKAPAIIFPKLGEKETADSCLWSKLVGAFEMKRLEGEISTEDRKLYWDRMAYEYETLKKMNFTAYILVVNDIIEHVKSKGGLVVCRGSAGGSLILWILGASCTDSIEHDLSFERFYDATRPDPPDIDIDFERAYRDVAIDYIFRVYGQDNCALISTLSKLKAKQALADTAKAFGLQRADYEMLSRALDEKDMDTAHNLSMITDPAAIAVLQEHPELQVFDKIVGQYRQSSIHAAGVLISSRPISESVGIIMSKGDTRPVATVDKHGAADLDFLKIDALVVEALDSIASAARKIWGCVDPLYKLKFDDKNVLEMANRSLTGVFQLEGSSAERTVREIGISSFQDLYAASALCRPGPADFIPVYKANKESYQTFHDSIEHYHPTAKEIILQTYGVVLYQEQVMKFARELAGFTWPDVHKLRKGITSSSGDAFQVWKGKFINGCTVNGVSLQEAEFWWSALSTHGMYSFNKSHCVTYGIVGYWTLYLKTYYPAQYYESQIENEGDPMVRKKLLREFQACGATLHLIDHTHSRAKTRAIGNNIYGGYGDLAMMGPGKAEEADKLAPFEDYVSMLDVMHPKTRDMLTAVYDGQNWDVPKLIKLAPWFPIPQLRAKKYGHSPAALRDYPISDVVIEGWVVKTDYEKDRTMFWLEDCFGSCLVRVSASKKAKLQSKVRQIKEGDYVACQGWWSGDTLYISGHVIIETA